MSGQRPNNSAVSCCTSDCKKQYGDCASDSSQRAIKKYQKKLDELKTIFYLALERYKESYPLAMGDSNDVNVRLYEESKNKLDQTFNDLYILESQIVSNLEQLDKGVERQDNILLDLKKRYSSDKHSLENVRNSNLASYPMKREFQQTRVNGYVDLAYYVVASVMIGSLFLKARKGYGWNPTAIPVKYNSQAGKLIVSPEVANISTISAAIIAGLIAAYYG